MDKLIFTFTTQSTKTQSEVTNEPPPTFISKHSRTWAVHLQRGQWICPEEIELFGWDSISRDSNWNRISLKLKSQILIFRFYRMKGCVTYWKGIDVGASCATFRRPSFQQFFDYIDLTWSIYKVAPSLPSFHSHFFHNNPDCSISSGKASPCSPPSPWPVFRLRDPGIGWHRCLR